MIEAKLKRYALYIFYGLLAYMPLHIFISTWVGTSWHILPFMKIAKDIVLVVGFMLALAASLRKAWLKTLLRSRLVWLVLAYAGLTAFMAVLKPTDQDAEVLGLVYNTRFLMMFLYAALLANLYSPKTLIANASKLVVGAGVVVALFGVVQYVILPDNALVRVGYSQQNGVLPAFFIDDKPDLERVMSTLRDPNSLGSYLIIILSFVGAGLALKWNNKDVRTLLLGIFGLAGLCLLYTFSRSAWLGAIVTAAVAFVILRRKFNLNLIYKKQILLLLIVSIFLSGVALVAGRNSYFVQNVVFHADESTVLEDPNQLRARFFQESVEGIAQNPLGSGPGTAGLASIRNNVQGTVLNENYYLQVATEVGIIGLLLFLAILYVVGTRLWHMSADPYALALLASFVGLFITNLFVHTWSNEAVAYTWWGLAGLALSSNSHNKKQFNNCYTI